MSQDNINQLPGFRFHPTPEELLGCLERKVKGITPEVIPEAAVYEVEPWQLPAHAFDGVDGNLRRFRLTKIKKKIRGRRRVGRQTGGGKWNSKYKKDIKNSPETVIGYETYLVYQIKEPSSSKWIDTRWRMHEYRLPSEQCLSVEKEWVLCKITSKGGSSNSTETDHYSGPQQHGGGDGDGDIASAEGRNGGLEMGEKESVTYNPHPTRGYEGETASHDPFGVYGHGNQATYVQPGETYCYSFSNTVDCDNQLFSHPTFSRSLDDNRFLSTMNQVEQFTRFQNESVPHSPQPTQQGGYEGETASHDPFGVYRHGNQATYVQPGETYCYSFSNTVDCDNQLFSHPTFSRSLDDNRLLSTMNQVEQFTRFQNESVPHNPQPTQQGGYEGETASHDPFGVYRHGNQATYVQPGETSCYSFSNTVDCDNQLFSHPTFSRSPDDNRFLSTMNQVKQFTRFQNESVPYNPHPIHQGGFEGETASHDPFGVYGCANRASYVQLEEISSFPDTVDCDNQFSDPNFSRSLDDNRFFSTMNQVEQFTGFQNVPVVPICQYAGGII